MLKTMLGTLFVFFLLLLALCVAVLLFSANKSSYWAEAGIGIASLIAIIVIVCAEHDRV